MRFQNLRFARSAAFCRDRFVSIVSITVLLTVLGLVMATTILSPLKDDVAWLLYVARNWLAGQRLYEDLIEVNPPLIIWLYAVPAAVAGWLNTPPKLIAVPMFATLMLASAWWCANLLRDQGPLFARRTPVFAAIGIVLLALPGVEFGQREHLMSAALLPYLCLMAAWLDGQKERHLEAVAAGVLAGLGCALKPTYGLAFLLPEAICFLTTRRVFRLAPMAAVGAAALYGASVLLFCPAYLARAVPLALALYGGTDTPLWGLVVEGRTLVFGVAAASVLWAISRKSDGLAPFSRRLMTILISFAIGATICYLLQGKNWFYHRLPAITATVLALVLWSAEMLPRLRRASLLQRPSWPAAALVCSALVAFVYADIQRMRPWIDEAIEPELSTEVRLEKIIRKEKVRTYVAFSEWIGLGFPVVNNTGVIWTSRFDSMWALKGELWRARQDGRAPAQWPIRRWVARDFITGCPDLVVVDVRNGGINYISVLVASDPAFAHVWTRYRQIALFNGLRVLKRDSADCGEPGPRPRMAASDYEAP